MRNYSNRKTGSVLETSGRSAPEPFPVTRKSMNEAGKKCPSCNSDVGIRLLWPDGGLRCPCCHAKLKYNPAGVGFFSLIFFVYLSIATIAMYLTSDLLIVRMSARAYMLFWMGVGFCLWIPFGLLASYHLRKKSKLELKNS